MTGCIQDVFAGRFFLQPYESAELKGLSSNGYVRKVENLEERQKSRSIGHLDSWVWQGSHETDQFES
jgi:hypothetical protein